jgi:hypothetical protein
MVRAPPRDSDPFIETRLIITRLHLAIRSVQAVLVESVALRKKVAHTIASARSGGVFVKVRATSSSAAPSVVTSDGVVLKKAS